MNDDDTIVIPDFTNGKIDPASVYGCVLAFNHLETVVTLANVIRQLAERGIHRETVPLADQMELDYYMEEGVIFEWEGMLVFHEAVEMLRSYLAL